MKVHQAGLLVVGLIGSSLSEEQELLLERFKYLIPFLDGDAAGRAAAAHALPRLARRSFIRVVELPEGEPDQLRPIEPCKIPDDTSIVSGVNL